MRKSPNRHGSGIFILLFIFLYDISIKVIGYEWENNEFALPREDRSPAESPSARCRLVRPGAAMETWPETRRYRGVKCVLETVRIWVVPRKDIAFRPNGLGREVFFCPKFPI